MIQMLLVAYSRIGFYLTYQLMFAILQKVSLPKNEFRMELCRERTTLVGLDMVGPAHHAAPCTDTALQFTHWIRP